MLAKELGVVPRVREVQAVVAPQRLGFREALDFTVDTFVKGLRLQRLERRASTRKTRRRPTS